MFSGAVADKQRPLPVQVLDAPIFDDLLIHPTEDMLILPLTNEDDVQMDTTIELPSTSDRVFMDVDITITEVLSDEVRAQPEEVPAPMNLRGQLLSTIGQCGI